MPRSPRKGQWNRAAAKCDGRCWYCGCVPEPGKLTVDHAFPRSRGGSNGEDNLLPACFRCNNDKGNMSIAEYRKWCKVRIIRRLIPFGFFSNDMSRLHITFWGEGNDSPVGW